MRRPARPSGRLTPLDPRLLRAAPALRRHVAVLVPLVALRGVATVAAAVLLAQALAAVWAGDAPRSLVALAVVLAARAAVDGLVDWLGTRAGNCARRQLRGAAMRGIVEAGPLELGRRDPARVAHAVGPGLDLLDGYVVRVLPALVAAVVVPPVVLAWVARTDLVSAGILLVTLPLVPVFLVVLGLTTRDRTERSYATLARLSARMLDLLEGLPTLKVHGRAAGQVVAVARVAERHRVETVSALRWAFLSGLALDLIATLSVALVALSTGLRLDGGSVQLVPALVVLLLAPEVFAPLRAVGAQYHASADALEAAGAALELATAPALVVSGSLLEGEPVVSLVDATVRYPERPVAALREVTLTLPPGQVVAVEGPSGAGKSTLLQLLLGALGPETGTVVTACSGATWRARLGWLPQRPRPSRPTAGDEVRLGNPDADDAQVAAALAECAAPSAGTPLGEDGASVSAGQRRRIALARALLRARAVAARGETPLVLLDEPSEDLDRLGEQVVARVVHALRGTATVVLVTHSRRLAAVADRVVRLEEGRIVRDTLQAAEHPAAPAAERPVERLAVHDGATAPDEVTSRPWRATDLLRALRVDGAGLGARTALVVGLGAAGSLAALGLAGASAWLVLRAAEQPGVQALALATVAVRTFALAKALLRYAERLAAHDVALRLLARTRVRVVEALVPLAPSGLQLWRRGDLLRRFTADVDAVQDAVVRGLFPVTSALTSGLAALVVTAWLAPSAVLPLLTGLMLAAACAPLAALAGRSGAQAAADAAGRRDRAAVGWVESAGELWVHDVQDADAELVLQLDDRVARLSRPARMSSSVSTALVGLTAGVTPLAVLASASGQVSGVTAGVVALLAVVAVEPVAALAPAWSALGTSMERAGRVAALLSVPVPVPEPTRPAAVPSGPVALTARDAVLAHPGGPTVLDRVDLQVDRGRRVAVVGPSGSGKSTLVAAALRLLQPRDGLVGLDDGMQVTPMDRLRAVDVPPLVAGCLQDDHLFSATLRENLRIGRPGASDDELDDVAARLGLLAWVRSLPDGWSTRAGADGAHVSGGQRQRLLLARALLADPGVLVLDEPTAHLDPQTEELVMHDLLRATEGRTVLLSTHRTAGLDQMDRVLRVDDGRVAPELPAAG